MEPGRYAFREAFELGVSIRDSFCASHKICNSVVWPRGEGSGSQGWVNVELHLRKRDIAVGIAVLVEELESQRFFSSVQPDTEKGLVTVRYSIPYV
jgi:hypothetical protein